MQLPAYIKKVLTLLEEKGFVAYVVGGAVRDFMLDIQPKDYDIATNAVPETVCAIAEDNGLKIVQNLGQNFGVVLLVVEDRQVEVGTFRSEKYGVDAHRPQSVTFCQTLEEDLLRRDFTINAMAVDKEGNIFDPHSGKDDLFAGILKTVGEARKKFAEDALRMFRACRFCAQLGFLPDKELLAAMLSEVERAQGLSLARVKDELEKTLLAKHVDIGIQFFVKSGLASQQVTVRENGNTGNIAILPELKNLMIVKESKCVDQYAVWQHTLTALSLSKQELVVRWCILLHDMGRGYDSIKKEEVFQPHIFMTRDCFAAELARKILARFGYGKIFIDKAVWLLLNHTKFISFLRSDEAIVRRWLKEEVRKGYFNSSQELYQLVEKLCEVCLADIAAKRSLEENIMIFREFGYMIVAYAANMPVHTSDLAIKGKDVLNFLPAKAVEKFLRDALARVQDGDLKNTKSALMDFLVCYKI